MIKDCNTPRPIEKSWKEMHISEVLNKINQAYRSYIHVRIYRAEKDTSYGFKPSFVLYVHSIFVMNIMYSISL